MPFVPQDMSPDEKTLLASISDQMVVHRGATTPQQVQAARNEAQQVAGEMIWAERAGSLPSEEEEPLTEELTAYYGRLAAAAAENRAMYEDEPEYYELPERQPKG
jgi:hypothetical protein